MRPICALESTLGKSEPLPWVVHDHPPRGPSCTTTFPMWVFGTPNSQVVHCILQLNLGHLYTSDKWPWPPLSKISQWLENEWQFPFVFTYKVVRNKSVRGWICRKLGWDMKVAWTPTCSWLNSVWWSHVFAARTPHGFLESKKQCDHIQRTNMFSKYWT